MGHHRYALVPLQALSSAALELMPGHVLSHQLELSPPRDCAIILEDQTEQILRKVQRELPNRTSKAAHREAYLRLKDELGRAPDLMAFWGRLDVPEFRELCWTFGSWIDLRLTMDDADDWERTVQDDALAWELLKAAETDLQLQRVAGYAALWALAFFPDDLSRGITRFFGRFPHWRVEGQVDLTQALSILEKKTPFKNILSGGRLAPALHGRLIRDPRLAQEVQRRLEYTLACDHTARHRGVLRKPEDLARYTGYRRGEIVNHFGVQFDPARHNTGVLRFGRHLVLLTQLDTRDAKAQHQYQNAFLSGGRHFSWQSQNRQTPESGSGREIEEHKALGNTVHLFVQGRTAHLYFYLGEVVVVHTRGAFPFTATFQLRTYAKLRDGFFSCWRM